MRALQNFGSRLISEDGEEVHITHTEVLQERRGITMTYDEQMGRRIFSRMLNREDVTHKDEENTRTKSPSPNCGAAESILSASLEQVTKVKTKACSQLLAKIKSLRVVPRNDMR